MKEQLLAYNTDPQRKSHGRKDNATPPFSQRDCSGTRTGKLSQRIQSDALDALGAELHRQAVDHDRAKAARRYAILTKKEKAKA